MPVFSCVDHYTEGSPAALRVSLQLSASFVAALFSYFLVERPFLRLKHRLASSDTTQTERPTTRKATAA
jgi:peptidoglycan/LPS O-acetylase OafA/YrhL